VTQKLAPKAQRHQSTLERWFVDHIGNGGGGCWLLDGRSGRGPGGVAQRYEDPFDIDL
jgi:hypothetical protein